MQQLVCTIDTSSVIALDHLGLLPQLSLIFWRVLLPKQVRTELYRRRKTKDRVQAIIRDYDFVERCNKYDQAAVDVLLIERAQLGVRDRGEAETVLQATEIGTTVIIDEPWGRSLAARHGRECHGVLWVLSRLHELERASSTVTRDRFLELFRRGIRLPPKEVNAFLAEIGEQPIVNAKALGKRVQNGRDRKRP